MYALVNVIMTWDLSWKNHHEYVLSKAYKILGHLQRIFSNVGCTLAKRNYISLVRSQLMYCSQMWHPQYAYKDSKTYKDEPLSSLLMAILPVKNLLD